MELGEGVPEGADHAHVGDRVPRPTRSGGLASLRHRRPVEPEPRAEGPPLRSDQDDPHVVVGVRRIQGGPELVAQLDGDGVHLVGAAEHEVPHRPVVFDADRSPHDRLLVMVGRDRAAP